MTTIQAALRSGVLEEFRLSEWERRDPLRPLYVAGELFDWVESNEDLHIAKWGNRTGGRTRYEHLEQMFNDFRCDVRPLVGDMNRVQPTKQGIWKMQCPGLRIFGWVPAPHSFVAVAPEFADATHGKGAGARIDELVRDTLKFAADHGLESTIIKGDRLALFPPQA